MKLSEKIFGCLALSLLTLTLASVIVPKFIRPRAQGRSSACKSNLKNIGTALEMYSTDWSGKYPRNLGQLTPKYLKTIPECTAAGSNTYSYQTESAAYNTQHFEDYYLIACKHGNGPHRGVNVPNGYPQYDGIQGLIER